MQKKPLNALAKQILEQVASRQCDAAAVSLSREQGFDVTVRVGELERVEHHQGQSLSLTVFHQKRTGSVSISDFSPAAIQSAVERACNVVKYTEADDCAGLADTSELAFNYPDCDLHHPWAITSESAIELALQCDNAAREFDPLISGTDATSVYSYDVEVCLANSAGFIGEFNKTTHGMSCEVLAKKGEQLQRDFDYSSARNPAQLLSPAEVGRSAAQKAVKRLGARAIKTQTCPVIFSSSLAKSLWGNLIGAISGSNLYRQNSFLCDAFGTQILPDSVMVHQDPHLPGFYGSRPFDSDGVNTKKNVYIENGKLTSYVLGSYSARKLNLSSTGNSGGVFNLFISHHNLNFNELLAEMGTGFLVTELIGQGVNILTGDYSRGAFGFWVEKGKIIHPVEEVTIAGNLRDMFKNLRLISNDIDGRGNVHTGSVLLNNMTIGGD